MSRTQVFVKKCSKDHYNQLDFCRDPECVGFLDPETHDEFGYLKEMSRNQCQPTLVEGSEEYVGEEVKKETGKEEKEEENEKEKEEENKEEKAESEENEEEMEEDDTVYKFINGYYRPIKNCRLEHDNQLNYCHDMQCIGYVDPSNTDY